MTHLASNAPPSVDRSIGHLLEFLSPGLVHGLGNSIFAIRGAAHVMGLGDRDPVRSQRVVIEATDRAETLLEILRYLSGVDPKTASIQPGVLLQRLVAVIRIPLRDVGLRVEVAHGSHESPVMVDPCAMTRAICEVVTAIGRSLPRGLEGRLVLDLTQQSRGAARVEATIEVDASMLPFPLDIGTVVEAARAPLLADGVAIERVDHERLALTIGSDVGRSRFGHSGEA